MAAAQPVEETTRLIDGLHVVQYGRRDAEPIVLSAGLGGSGAYWMPQVESLSEDYHVILYDHRGTGQSARDIPDDYSVGHMADDICAILDGLGIEAAHVVGHAAGALAGLELARTKPDRLLSLTCVNGWAVADKYFKRCFEIRSEIFRTQGVEGYLKAQPIFLYPAEWISNHLDELDAHAAQTAGAFQAAPVLMARIEALKTFDITASLKDIHVPILVISAADDMLVPARSSRLLSDALPNVMPVEMPWGGHAVNVTATKEFDKHLTSFLRARGAQP